MIKFPHLFWAGHGETHSDDINTILSGMGGATVFTDDFSGEVGDVDLAAHTPSGGGVWTRQGGFINSLKVLFFTNAVGQTNTAGRTFYSSTDLGTADHYSEITLERNAANVSGFYMACVRGADSNNFIGIHFNGSNIVNLRKCLAGSITNQGDNPLTIGAVAIAPLLGDTIRVEASGNNITVKLNGTACDNMPVVISDLNTNTLSGLAGDGTSIGALVSTYEAGTL